MSGGDVLMTRLSLLTLVLAVGAGCERSPDRTFFPTARPSPPIAPAPGPPPALPKPVVRAIAVGDEVTDTFTGTDLFFEVVAPADGTLVGELSWDPFRTESALALMLADVRFAPDLHDWNRWSPIVGRVPVVAGGRYSIIVSRGETWSEYDDPFVLKTWME